MSLSAPLLSVLEQKKHSVRESNLLLRVSDIKRVVLDIEYFLPATTRLKVVRSTELS